MKSINPKSIDLNLLHLFLLVHECKSVSKAGSQLGLSQPASSNALNRLRESLGDPLFVRVKDGMVPTPYSQRIIEDVKLHLAKLQQVLLHREIFDPKLESHTFRLSLSGLGEAMFFPTIMKEVLAEAPKSQFKNVAVSLEDLPKALQSGDTELAIGIINSDQRGIKSKTLFQESYMLIAGSGLPAGYDSRIELNKVGLVLPAPETTYAEELEVWVNRMGFSQNIVARLRHFGALPDLLNQFDFAAIVPSNYARRLSSQGPIRCISEIPGLGRRSVRMVWHERNETDPSALWFRNKVAEALTIPNADLKKHQSA